MTKKLLLSLGVVTVAVATAVGGTIAYFSDTETSTGNLFQAGAIDLKVSNSSYVSDKITGALIASPNTSWISKDLVDEKFFNFTDLKPGDVGEDTIDLTVSSNDAWACAELTLTSNEDVTCTEPEKADDPDCVASTLALFNGELAQGIEFVWWSDDGDNVLEVGEEATKYYLGPDSISNLLGPDSKLHLTLADKYLNFFDRTRLDMSQEVKPLKGGTTYYLGKGWCFGEMTLAPVAQGGQGGPLERGTGFTCNGVPVNNASQTDMLTADVAFTAVQARNNANYLCPEHQTGEVPETRNISLENKNLSWSIISDDQIYGLIQYSHNDTTFHGVVTGTGLVAGGKYQITLNGPGGCTLTDHGFAGIGSNAFSSGYWNNGTNLEPTCGTPGEGVYNMSLVDDHYTFIADGSGAFSQPFTLNLPDGDYSGVKVLVKKMLDTHVSPWADTTGNYPAFNLYETAPISFTVL
jgi:predicted ribosomally synthesized peptide with SipW-like signal peptide